MLPVEIPKTSVTGRASAEFDTVLDTNKATINPRIYRSAYDAYERVVSLVEEQINIAWKRKIGQSLARLLSSMKSFLGISVIVPVLSSAFLFLL